MNTVRPAFAIAAGLAALLSWSAAGYAAPQATPVRASPSPAAGSIARTAPAPSPGRTWDKPSARASVLTHGPDAAGKTIALTLDDGYGADPKLLDLIDDWQLRGTAFIVGAVADRNPALIRRLVASGWEVCSHTYTHKTLTGSSAEAVRAEISKGVEAVARIAGRRCPYFRPPGGAVNDTVVRVAREMGLTLVNWNASISDSTPASTPPSVQVGIALKTIQPGGILLGHFGGTHSYVVLKEVLTTIFAQGYRVGSVTDLLDGRPIVQPAVQTKVVDDHGVTFANVLDGPLALPAGHGVTWRTASHRMPPGGWLGLLVLGLGAALVAVSWRRRQVAMDHGPEPALMELRAGAPERVRASPVAGGREHEQRVPARGRDVQLGEPASGLGHGSHRIG